MTLYGVSFEPTASAYRGLKTVNDDRFLPIWIGHPEAAAILMKLQGRVLHADDARPLDRRHLGAARRARQSHDHQSCDNTYYARITISQDGREVEIDSRPSDAIAMAVRCDAQIFASDEVVDESGIELHAEDDEQPGLVTASNLADLDPAEFRQFLENVTPEEFASSLEEEALEDEEPLEDEDEEVP